MFKKVSALFVIICLSAVLTACSNTDKNGVNSLISSTQLSSGSTGNPDGSGSSGSPDCSGSPDGSGSGGNDPAKETDSQNPESGLRHVSEMMGRFGSKDGFYFFKSYHPANEMDDSYDNLMYIDYTTGKQVYLCSKSNCSHSDAGCTSYIPANGAQGLFTYDNKLYRLSDGGTLDGITVAPGLYVSDLDGSNPKMLYQLDSGMRWLRDFVIGSGVLYADVMVMEMDNSTNENGFGFISGDDGNSRLLSIDLNTGKEKIVYDLTNKKIAGVFGSSIVISEPKSGEMVFSLFDTASGTSSASGTAIEAGRIENTTVYAHSGGKVYYALSDTLHSLDLQSGVRQQIASGLPASPDYMEIHSGFAVCEQLGGSSTPVHFAVDLSSGTVSRINLFKSGLDFKTPIEIEAEWGDYFLVCNGYKIEQEYVDWAGVWQEYIDQEHFALIKKDDFLSGRADYLPIQ